MKKGKTNSDGGFYYTPSSRPIPKEEEEFIKKEEFKIE